MRARPTARGLLAAALMAAAPGAVAGQLRVSGQIDLLAKSGPDEALANRNFRGDSPFNDVRLHLFGQHWLNDRVGVFTEILFDIDAAPRVNGAYVVVNELGGREWANLRAGLAPSLIGSFGLRSNYFNLNPLIGVPMIWQYRTTLDGSGLADAGDLLRRRRTNIRGLPTLYDSCWNIVWELMGGVGRFEYSVGVTPGALSNPPSATAEDGVQWLARLGVEPVPGVRVGISGALGPYIGGPSRDPLVSATSFPGGPSDYDQRLVGYDLEYTGSRFVLVTEEYLSRWELPLVPEAVHVLGGYVEGRHDFLPRWFAALRLGALRFSDIDDPDAAGSAKTGWDDDVLRSPR